MTDAELVRAFRAAPIKAVMVIQAAQTEGIPIPDMAARLEKLGCRAHVGIRRAFKKIDMENIDEKAVKAYLRKYGIREEEPEQATGVISAYCKGCRYLSREGWPSCGYYTRTKKRRGCPAGDGCIRKETEG